MRPCSASAVRILSLLYLAVLSSHSFVNAQSSSDVSPVLSPSLPVDPPASPSPSSPTPSAPPVSTPPQPVSSSSPPPVSSQPPASSPTSPPPPASSSSAPPAATVQSSSSTQQSSSSSSAASSSGSSSSSASSSSSTSSSSSSSARSSVTPIVQQTGGRSTTYVYGSTDFSVPTPSTSSDAAEATGATNTAPKSFLENKPAMAGTFTVAGVIGLLIVAFIAIKVMKRRSRARDEEEDAYFEKYSPEHEPPMQQSGAGAMESSYDIAHATAPARHDAYPDRAMHYGSEQAYGNPTQYGMEYPPGTAYGADAAQDGQYQYQYSGQSGQYSPTNSHPFADPQNSHRPAPAPPVNRAYEQDPYTGYAQ